MREIGEGVRLRSTSSVAHQLMALERKGFLYRDPHRPRAYRVRSGQHAGLPDAPAGMAPEAVQVPLVGRIAAGTPILAEELVEDVLPMPRYLVGEGKLFALKLERRRVRSAAPYGSCGCSYRSEARAEPSLDRVGI